MFRELKNNSTLDDGIIPSQADWKAGSSSKNESSWIPAWIDIIPLTGLDANCPALTARELRHRHTNKTTMTISAIPPSEHPTAIATVELLWESGDGKTVGVGDAFGDVAVTVGNGVRVSGGEVAEAGSDVAVAAGEVAVASGDVAVSVGAGVTVREREVAVASGEVAVTV
jgi:hypothetical protein